MPELPDVEAFRRRVASAAVHQTIRHVELSAPEMLKGMSARDLRARLEGHRIKAARRYGKHLLLEIGDGGWLDLHFGMSGFPQYVEAGAPRPRFTRMVLDLDHGQLAYVVPRRIGRIALMDSLDQLIEGKGLGPDALDPKLTFDRFRQLATGRGAVKCWLMDQSQIAGIGNVYSDEILFQARIDPRRRVGDLSENELRRLYDTLHAVIAGALACDADPARLPSDWLLTSRRAGLPCPGTCKGRIQRMELCGRSAYVCTECQH